MRAGPPLTARRSTLRWRSHHEASERLLTFIGSAHDWVQSLSIPSAAIWV
jgi:hypothetical protein